MSTVGRNTLYNLVGTGIPLVLFIVTIPLYIAEIGAARYGVLAVVWLVLGLFGMMDLGLGRAATQQIATLRDADDNDRRSVLGSALVGNAIVGALGAVVMTGVSWYVFAEGMQLEDWLRAEALPLVPLMALAVPVATSFGILAGALQGRERFFVVNRIAITNSTLFQLLPLAVAWMYGPSLFWLVIAALGARVIAVALLWRECRLEFGAGWLASSYRGRLAAMLRYGGWVTVTGVVGMVLVFSDRLIIGSIIGAVAVTIYAVPLDATRRLAIIADALANALFPRLAIAGEDQSRDLTRRAVSMLYAIATPAIAAVIVLADPITRLWLGDEIGSQAGPLMQILGVAAWINIFAKLPYAKLQAQGNPRAVAIAAIIQMPPFFLALWYALQAFGLAGAAWVYLGRNTLDFVLLSVFAYRGLACGPMLIATFIILVGEVIVLQIITPLALAPALIIAVLLGLSGLVVGWLALPREVHSSLKQLIVTPLRK